MPVYDVLVSDELLPEFTNDNPRMPAGFRVLEVLLVPDARQGVTRVRVSDENAPAWTEGKLIDPVFTQDWESVNDRPTGNFTVRVTAWTEMART